METKTFVVQDLAGNAMPLADCSLFYAGTTDLVAGVLDANDQPLINPFKSNSLGEVVFKAPNGLYDLFAATAVRESTRRVQCLDLATVIWLEQQVEYLLYKPPKIELLQIDGNNSKTLEVGASAESVVLNWTLSGAESDSQVISNGGGDVPVGTTETTITGPFTDDQSWTLTLADINPIDEEVSATATVALNFRHKRYWGVSASTELTNAEILALSSEFATTNDKSVTYNATGGQYPYFCYPESWGALEAVSVGGLAFSAYTESIQPFTNASGHTESYRVVRFDGLQTGANIQVVWS